MTARATLAALSLLLPLTAVAQSTATVVAPTTSAALWPILDSLVGAELVRTHTPGAQVAVVVDGKLAYTKGYGTADIETGRAVTDRTLFRVGSVTKMFTAALLTQLAANGKLDLQAPISNYVTELAGRKVGTVTTHQLLTHSAGWLDNAIPFGSADETALGDVMRNVTDTLFFTEPGRVISYSNPGYSMAGYIGARAGGSRYATLMDQQVLRPVGMERATFRPLEAMTRDFSQGHVGPPTSNGVIVRPFTENTAQWGAGFLFASAGELARFTIALMADGVIDGNRVLPSEAVRNMTAGYMPVPGSATAKYGYGLMIDTRNGTRVWQHGGAINGFDAQVTMFPDKHMAVIILDNRSGAPLRGIIDLVALSSAGITPPPPPPTPEERVGTPAERAQVVGRYRMGTTSVEIVEENGALVFVQGDRAPMKLVGTDQVVVIPPGAPKVPLLLVRGADGRVEYLHQGLRALARQP